MLAVPDGFVPKASKGTHGKSCLLGLELLETNHVRLSFGQPSQKVIKPLVNVVDVEAGDFHERLSGSGSRLPRSSQDLPRKSGDWFRPGSSTDTQSRNP